MVSMNGYIHGDHFIFRRKSMDFGMLESNGFIKGLL